MLSLEMEIAVNSLASDGGSGENGEYEDKRN